MKSLNENRLNELRRHLEKCGTEATFLPELLDHLACEAEERLWEGEPYEVVLQELVQEADPLVLTHLQIERKQWLISDASLTDIVFENRNRLYGAYVLRREYPGHVMIATLLGLMLFWVICLLPALCHYFFA